MNNSKQVNRQNRVLVITIAVILAFAAVLVCLTVMQDRREKPAPLPPADSATDAGTAGSAPTTSHTNKESPVPLTPSDATDTTASSESDTTAAMEPEEIVEPVNAADVLPNFIAPVAGMVTKSHQVDVPVYSLTMNDYRTHCGVDIVSTSGSAVCAAADGKIAEIWEEPMMGVCLSIEHTGGARSIYKNLAPQLPDGVVVGASVKVGDRIAAIGESALMEVAESPHLHYELEIDGVCVNPADYMLIGSEDTGYEG